MQPNTCRFQASSKEYLVNVLHMQFYETIIAYFWSGDASQLVYTQLLLVDLVLRGLAAK